MENIMEISLKTGNRLVIYSSIPTTGKYPNDVSTWRPRHLCHFYSSTIHNSQNTDSPKVSFTSHMWSYFFFIHSPTSTSLSFHLWHRYIDIYDIDHIYYLRYIAYTMEYDSATENNEILSFATKQLLWRTWCYVK